MNSIKNAIVTVTLLAVGYGAYQVLKNPSQDDFHTFTQNQQQLIAPTAELDTNTPDPITVPEIQTELPELPAEAVAASPDGSPFVPPPLLSASGGEPKASAEYTSIDPPQSAISNSSPTSASSTQTSAAAASRSAPSSIYGGFDAPGVNAANTPRPWIANSSDAANAPGVATPTIDHALGPIPSAAGNVDFEQDWQTAQQQVRDGDTAAALTTLSPWHSDSSLNDEQRSRCRQLLDQLAGSVIYSRNHLLESEYIVQAGETLEEIATQYDVPRDFLAKINGIAPPYALATGESLKVVRGPFRAEVTLDRNELVLFLGANYAGRFPVSIGQDLPKQEAYYRVAEKSNGRNYFDRRTGQEVLQGTANNRYGEHWVGLRGEQITSGHSVGIHGRPSNASQNDIGSVSLDPLDAEDVYSILSIGSRIQIRR